MTRWLGYFLLGATAGSLLDGIHTHSGMTLYPTPWIWMMAWWTPLVFGFAVVSIAGNHLWLDRVAPRPAPSTENVLFAVTTFVAAYFATGYLPFDNPPKIAILAAMAVGAWLAFDRSWQGALMAIVTAVLGPLFEVGMTHLGLFQHLHPDVWGVPLWLCGLYACASVAIGNLARRLSAEA